MLKRKSTAFERLELWPFADLPGDETTLHCLHCSGSFRFADISVDVTDGLLTCPVGSCNGSPGDFTRHTH